MSRLEFIPGTRAAWQRLRDAPAEFARQQNVRLHDALEEIASMTLDFLGRFPPETPEQWFGYLAADGESRQVVGVCSFKGPPVDRAVEISYGTFSGFEGRGIATKMARYLVERAQESDEVDTVFAHTLPKPNASNHILRKLGMQFTGDAQEDGMPVWRWEMRLR